MTDALDPDFYDTGAHDYDAVLVVSFGGPEGPDDVMPFLENVFRGLRVTDETKERIAARYHDFGGVSPINGETREFITALERELAAHGPRLPVYWGNRNWHPLLPDTIARMAAAGVRRAAAYVTSTFSSYSGCRKYREDLYAACDGVANAPLIDKLRVGFNHPGFVAAATERVRAALDEVPSERRNAAALLFTAHSLPESMAARSPYVRQLLDCCGSIAAGLGRSKDGTDASSRAGESLEHAEPAGGHRALSGTGGQRAAAGIRSQRAAAGAGWQLTYQSNNARYGGEPWLGPDIKEALSSARDAGFRDVVVAPIGFVCDHMEVVLDLDVDAAAHAGEIGVNMVRAGTVGTHPDYVAMVRELLLERMDANAGRQTIGALPPKHDFCPTDCCLSGRPGPAKPSLCGAEHAFYGWGD